jgi:hypothetical protein
MSQIELQYVLDYVRQYINVFSKGNENHIMYMIDDLKTILDSDSTEEECNYAFIDMYTFLNTDEGSQFLRSSRRITEILMYFARGLMEKIDDNLQIDLNLSREISLFSRKNQDIFVEHGITFTVYYGYDEEEEDDEEEDEEEEEDDEDDEEEDDEDDEDDDWVGYEEFMQNLQEVEEVKQRRKAKQEWDNRIILVNEHLRRRNDPFYVAAINCVKTVQKKKENDWLNENTRQLRLVKNILRREMETGREITSGNEFSCEYELVERYTGVKVADELSRKFGCRFFVTYNNENCSTTVTIFDGVEIHEFDIIANIPSMIPRLKKEIRKDTAQCLYDTTLFCRDIAGVISEFML